MQIVSIVGRAVAISLMLGWLAPPWFVWLLLCRCRECYPPVFVAACQYNGTIRIHWLNTLARYTADTLTRYTDTIRSIHRLDTLNARPCSLRRGAHVTGPVLAGTSDARRYGSAALTPCTATLLSIGTFGLDMLLEVFIS